LGGVDEDECAGEVVDARDGDTYSGAVGIDGLGQDSAVMMRFHALMICISNEEIRKKRNEIEVDVRASRGAAVLRGYTDSYDGRCKVRA
jgi:hypothetical protein